MIKRLLCIATTLLPLTGFAQCPDQVTAGYSPTTVCATRDVQLNASNISGATYSWTGPLGFNSAQQNPVITAIPLNGSGHYIVTATVGSCQYVDTATIPFPNTTPTPPSLYQNGPICEGDTLTLLADIVLGGPYYSYWFGPDSFVALSMTGQYVNIFNASVTNSGLYKVVAEDQFTGCRSDTSYMNVVVNPNLIPNVFITATDTTYTGPMVPIIFTANVTNAGANPTYQWQKNSVNIPGQTGPTYAGINGFDFQHQDTIGVLVAADASAPCAQSSFSNRLIVRINLAVDDLHQVPSIALHPNPNNGRFKLAGLPLYEAANISVLNAVGQVIYTTEITSTTGSEEIEMTEVADGMYLLQVKSAEGTRSTRFSYHR